MSPETIRSYCLEKKGTSECMPFDEETLVFKVCGKMFALLSLDEPAGLNLKCNPERAIELREQYTAITPGYHMNKKMWNTVLLDGSLDSQLIFELIDHSYNEVVSKLPLKVKAELMH